MIYLDNSATTQPRKEVVDFISKYSFENFFNPSSVYQPAVKVKLDLDSARKRLLTLLNADLGDKVVFTGSATEANNLVLNGLARKNKKILVSLGEHPSIYETAKNLANNGYNIDFIALNKDGTINLKDLESKLSQDVNLVSIIHVSNETGAINDIRQISKLIKSKNPTCLLHCDGVQAFGKVGVNVFQDNIDLYTVSSHKIHGPKGVACLYFNKNVNLKPHILGGGQENGLRSGTENPAGILGFVMAGEIMYENFDARIKHLKEIKQHFINELEKTDLKYQINGDLTNTVNNILSVSFFGIKGEVLLHCLEKYEIYVSTGSACSSKHVGNRVLTAMGLNNEEMQGNIRFSFSEFTTISDIDTTIRALVTEIHKLKDYK